MRRTAASPTTIGASRPPRNGRKTIVTKWLTAAGHVILSMLANIKVLSGAYLAGGIRPATAPGSSRIWLISRSGLAPRWELPCSRTSTPITGTPARRATPTSVPASPTMMVEVSCPPARATVCCRMTGSGFETPNVSAPHIAANRVLSPSLSSNRFDSHSSLLVQTASDKPAALELDRVLSQDPRTAAKVGDVGGVMRDEIRDQSIESSTPWRGPRLRGRARAAGARRRRSCCARLQRHRRHALAGQDGVERGDQVGRGVDQCAVEIEDDSAGGSHAKIAIGQRPSR